MHDIEFAAEISTSLISQVRGLQALLQEREEDLRDTKQDLAQLEDTTDTLRERIKELDESEHRYKEENWNLETRIHDLDAAQRDASDKDKKVAQQLAILQAQKNKTQRELDELKGVHARLVDEQAAAVKAHDIELGTAKRNIVLADGEKATLQRKVDDLAGQNQELARAVSMQARDRSVAGDSLPSTSDDDVDAANNQPTPDQSPPPSPVKGTPRHPGLETETLKTSLLHAQRTVQSLRTNLYREKTEKLELRRLLQESRDDLERARADPNAAVAAAAKAAKKGRKDVREKPKMRPSQLGGPRSSHTDLFIIASNDPDWEETDVEPSPSGAAARGRRRATDASDQFDTANEGIVSDASFTTANDGAETTAEAFHTGLEELSSDEETTTETEQQLPPRGRPISSRPRGSGSVSTARAPRDEDHELANQSTASTSDDEGITTPRTPTASKSGSTSRIRSRASRSSLATRRVRRMASIEDTGSSPLGGQGSPFSINDSPCVGAGPSSINSTPRVVGLQQSLFAELGELDEYSDEDQVHEGTPVRFRSPRALAPSATIGIAGSPGMFRGRSPLAQVLSYPKVVMVDRETLTDSVTITPWSEEEKQEHMKGLAPESRPTSFMSDASMGERLRSFPSPPSQSTRGTLLTPIVLSPPQSKPIEVAERTLDDAAELAEREPPVELTMSDVVSVPIEPVAEPVIPPSPILLALSSVLAEHVMPVNPPEPEPKEVPVFSSSALRAVQVAPVEAPPQEIPEPPAFSLSTVQAEQVVPAPLEPFSFSAVQSQYVDPISEPERALPVLEPFSLSGVQSRSVEPVSEPEPALPPLEPFAFSAVQSQYIEPISEPERALPAMAPFSVSGLLSQDVEPIAEPEQVVPAMEPFALSAVQSQYVEPISEPERVMPPLEPFSVTRFQSLEIHPISEPEPPVLPPALLSVSALQGEDVEPISPVDQPLPKMALSGVFSEDVEPIVVEESKEKATKEVSVLAVPAVAAVAAASAPVSSIGTQTDEWKPESIIGPVAALGAVVAAGDVVAGHGSSTTDATASRQGPRTPSKHAAGPMMGGWSKHNGPPTPVIAEDETRQSPSTGRLPETPESQLPLEEISANNQEVPRDMANKSGKQPFAVMPATFGQHSQNAFQDNIGSVRRGKAVDVTGGAAMRRPGSATSGRMSPDGSLPPLPANHREVIEAARSGSAGSMSSGVAAVTGPASPAIVRVQTPTGGAVREFNFATYGGMPTPKASIRNAAAGTGEMRPPSRPSSRANVSNAGGSVALGVPGTVSRQTSVSSFASEVNARFNIHDGDVFGHGAGSHIDPRMIQAITQTMIGEYLWKYTRKTGRSGLSERRHRRYFWIHPYTRMLYWSDQGPTAGSRVEQRAKSVIIEGVRVVTDDNPMPPGIHRKSLVVISPGRTIKFTCATGHGHEVWFNALSYLLLRKEDGAEDEGMTANGEQITRDDVEELNPAFGRRTNGSQARRQPPVSLSSYNSRTTHNESPAFGMTMNVPTLTPTPKKKNVGGTTGSSITPSRAAAGLTSRNRLSRFGGYWRSSTSLSTQFGVRKNRPQNSAAQVNGIYEASEVNDSAEEVREILVAQDRESGRLENVRACCDGKFEFQ